MLAQKDSSRMMKLQNNFSVICSPACDYAGSHEFLHVTLKLFTIFSEWQEKSSSSVCEYIHLSCVQCDENAYRHTNPMEAYVMAAIEM